MRLALTFLLSLAVVPLLFAQQASIYGRVNDAKGRPIEFTAIYFGTTGTTTNAQGTYRLELPAEKALKIMASHISFFSDSVEIRLAAGEERELNFKLFPNANVLNVVDIEDQQTRYEDIITINTKEIEVLPGPGGGVEGIIRTLPGVTNRSELSSQYSVRGGNFDENLVYINDIEIYRPFLVRAGQQEGMSFINSDMTQGIQFSAGGFAAKYGDKLSSVLDIKYKNPTDFFGMFNASLMGGGATVGDRSEDKKFSYLMGLRYRTNTLLLGSLDTEADFRPNYTDFQSYLSYRLSPRLTANFLGSYSRNKFNYIPQSRQTDFGTVSQALRLTVFFEGQEIDMYETALGAFSFDYLASDQTLLKFIASAYTTSEQEYFDIRGRYRLSELDNNLGSDNFGEEKFERGVGEQLYYGRNRLYAQVFSFEHKGYHTFLGNGGQLLWGAKFQNENISDRLKEWTMIDSAGYSIPQQPTDEVQLFETIDVRNDVISNRLLGYVQYNNQWENGKGLFVYQIGMRANYWSFSNELIFSPRGQISFEPNWEKEFVFRLSGGVYVQPPFYRELRDFDGTLNYNSKAQRSVQIVAASDYHFKALGRPFKFTSEAYYKSLNRMIPYEVDNVRIRYYANDISEGFATGLDFRLFGEFVKGVDSWLSVSFMSVQEDVEGDSYVDLDGMTIEPGLIPKPTDQRFSFSIFFQDYLPSDPTWSMSLTMFFASGLPFGPPQSERYQQTLRLPPYRRVDIGLMKVLVQEDRTRKPTGVFRHLNSAWAGLEVFNLFQIRNTVSYLWVMDVTGAEYAVPNYLTQRLINVKLTVKI